MLDTFAVLCMRNDRLALSCKFCRRQAFLLIALLSAFGLLLNVANDHLKLVGGPLAFKKQEDSSTVVLRPIPYANRYCVIYNYWKSENSFGNKSITLVLHSTLKHLHYLKEHASTWTGPISLAIFMPNPITKPSNSTSLSRHYLNTLFCMLNKLKASAGKRRNISIHLFYENNPSSNCKTTKYQFEQVACEDKLIKTMPNFFAIYPINLARNIARHKLTTRLFLSSDIEQLFSRNYERKVRALAYDKLLVKKEKAVLVHRRFEVVDGVDVPQTKAQLLKLYRQGTAVVFHKNFYFDGHFIPELTKWFTVDENNRTTSVFGQLNYTNPKFEPQFVGDALQVPYHNENFPFRLRSNTQLAAELCRADFRFFILNNVFSIHRDIKTKETSVELAARKLAFRSGYLKKVRKFLARLDQQYPATKNKCPKFCY